MRAYAFCPDPRVAWSQADMRVAWRMFNYARPDLPGAEQPWVFCDLEVAREAVRVKLGLRSYEPASPEDVRYRVEPTDTVGDDCGSRALDPRGWVLRQGVTSGCCVPARALRTRPAPHARAM